MAIRYLLFVKSEQTATWMLHYVQHDIRDIRVDSREQGLRPAAKSPVAGGRGGAKEISAKMRWANYFAKTYLATCAFAWEAAFR